MKSDPGAQPTDSSSSPARKPPSLEDVYRDHLGDIFVWLRRIRISEHDMEDVAHKVFMELHGALPSYDPERPLKPWLKSIAVRTGWHHLGQAHNHHETLVEDFTAADEAPSSEERLGEEQRARAVREVLASVDEVLALHELDGLAIEEISRKLEIPVNTLYSRRRRAIAQFKATWQQRHGKVAMGIVVPIGLVQSSGAALPGAEPLEVASALRERLWKRLQDELGDGLHLPARPPGSSLSRGAGGSSLGGAATSKLRRAGSFVQSRAMRSLLLFTLGAGSGAAAHLGLGATPSSGGEQRRLPSSPPLSLAPFSLAPGAMSSGAPLLADAPPATLRSGEARVELTLPPISSIGAPRSAPTAVLDAVRSPNRPTASASAASAGVAPPPPPSEGVIPPPPATGAPSAGAIDPALAKERQLIQTARAAMMRGDDPSALASLEQHRREFPRGALVEDRDDLLRQVRARMGAKP